MASDRRLGAVFWELRAKTEFLQKDLNDAERQFGKLSKFVLDNPVAAIGGVATALAGVAIAAARMAETVERNLARVSVATKGSADDVRALGQRIAQLSESTGRSQADLSDAAIAAAKTAESVNATGQRLAAALQLSTVTGTDLKETINSLDQVMDLFQISSSDAGKAVAELFVAARGKAPIGELFDALKTVAPEINKLKLDLPTAARALLQFSDQTGNSSKAIKKAFADFAEQGERGRIEIEKLAAAIPTAANPTAELAKAFNDVNDNASNAAQRLREQFNARLIELGTQILPAVNAGMQQLLRLFGADSTFNTKNIQNAVAELRSFGSEADGLFTASASGSQAAGRAVLLLADAVKNGQVALSDFDREGLAALQTRVQFFQDARYFDPEQLNQLRTLQRELQNARTALDAPKTGGRAGGNTGPTAAEIAAAQAAAEAAAKAQRDLEQGFADLFAKASEGSLSLGDFDKAVRELGDKFADTKNKTAGLTARFNELKAQSGGVRQALEIIRADKAALEFQKLRDALLPEAFRDFAVTIAALRDELTQKGITGDAADEIVRLTTLMHDATTAATELDRQIAVIGQSGLSPMQQAGLLLEKQRDLEAELLGVRGQGQTQDVQRAQINAQILKINQALDALGEKNAGNLKAAEVASNGLAEGLANAGQAALGIATAILGADNATTRAIAGAAQLAQSFRDIGKLASEAGGLSNLLSSGSGIVSALPAIGGIIGGVGAIATLFKSPGESPAQKLQRQTLEENNKRLRELRDGLVDAFSITSGGGKAATILNTDLSKTQLVNGVPTVTGGRDIKDILAELDKAGVGLADIKKIAKDLNVEFAHDVPSLAELAQLQAKIYENLQAVYKRFNESLAGQLSLLELRARIDPEAFKGINGLIERLKVLSADKTGSPLFKDVLALVQSGDLEGARRKLKEIFNLFAEGKLDPKLLGGIDPKDFLEFITQILEGINDATPEIKSAVEQFSDAFDALKALFDAGVIDARDFLNSLKLVFKDKFPEIFSQLDFSSLDAFKKSVGKIIQGFASDGVLTDAEKSQIQFLGLLTNAFEGTIAATDQLVDSVTALRDKFHLFDESAIEQFSDLVDAFKKKFPELAHLFDGFDVNTESGRDAIKAKIREIYNSLAKDGITESEQAIIDFLTQIFDTVVSASDKAIRDAKDKADAAAARRDNIFANVEAFIQINKITDPIEILKLKLKALAAAFPQLTEQLSHFDVATKEGRDALRAWLKLFLADNPALLEPLAKALGISVDQLRQFLLGLDTALDNTAAHIKTLAEKLQEAFNNANFEIDLSGITDPIQQLIIRAREVAKALPAINAAIGGLDLSTDAGRQAAIAKLVALGRSTTDQAVKDAVIQLLNEIRGIASATTPASQAPSPFEQQQALSLQGSPTATAVQFSLSLDLDRTRNALLRKIEQNTAAIAALYPRLDPSLLLQPPSLGSLGLSRTSGPGGFVFRVEQTNNFGGPLTPSQKAEGIAFTDDMLRRIDEGLRRLKDRDDLSGGATSR